MKSYKTIPVFNPHFASPNMKKKCLNPTSGLKLHYNPNLHPNLHPNPHPNPHCHSHPNRNPNPNPYSNPNPNPNPYPNPSPTHNPHPNPNSNLKTLPITLILQGNLDSKFGCQSIANVILQCNNVTV